ncbi:carbohydrate kinase [Niallia sp. 03133]|uniref:carbohydrate kinase n=1 Tax=Niallia sp. 03133 TaxID=3458060 RepID=UPI004043B0BF
MNEKEFVILQLIQENPFLTQNEIADKMGLSRSAVAGYISALTREGKLLGRAYVLPNKKEILCIGGANLDRKIQAHADIKLGISNLADSSQSCGGEARNIAENLGRLGCESSLLTIVGADHAGEWILEYTKPYVDFNPSLISNDQSTGTYTAVFDKTGDFVIGLADMSIYDSIQEDLIEKKWGYIASSELVILDTNFPAEVLKKVITKCWKGNIPLCVTAVSSSKVKKLPDDLFGVTWLIANKEEAEELSNIVIKEDGDFFKAAELIMNKGVERVVITRGDKGLIYFTQAGEAGAVLPPLVKIADETGAGEALVAGIIYSHLKGLQAEDACKIGSACSLLTIQSYETVNHELNQKKLQEAFKRYFY